MNAIMAKFDIDATEQQRSQSWEGFSELDQAVRKTAQSSRTHPSTGPCLVVVCVRICH